jgi:hypothetical protein
VKQGVVHSSGVRSPVKEPCAEYRGRTTQRILASRRGRYERAAFKTRVARSRTLEAHLPNRIRVLVKYRSVEVLHRAAARSFSFSFSSLWCLGNRIACLACRLLSDRVAVDDDYALLETTVAASVVVVDVVVVAHAAQYRGLLHCPLLHCTADRAAAARRSAYQEVRGRRRAHEHEAVHSMTVYVGRWCQERCLVQVVSGCSRLGRTGLFKTAASLPDLLKSFWSRFPLELSPDKSKCASARPHKRGASYAPTASKYV